MEAYTWFADVNDFDTLDHQTEVGAAWVCFLNVLKNSLQLVCRIITGSYHFEYSTRETYGGGFVWPETAPLSQ